MRRRIVAMVVASVVVALLLVGLGTFALTRAEAYRSAEETLDAQATSLVEVLALAFGPGEEELGPRPTLPRRALERLREASDVDKVGVMAITARGERIGQLPPGLALTKEQEADLEINGGISGRSGDLLYAVEQRKVGEGAVIVALTAPRDPIGLGGLRWFLLTSALVIPLSAIAAVQLGDRLSRPIARATAMAERISEGDLSSRLPDPTPGDMKEPAVLVRSVNAMADVLERSRVLEQQFLLSISHDLRTPLTSIRGYAETIADDGPESWNSAAQVILRESGRLDRLIGDLLDLARLDSREFRLRPHRGDLVAEAASAAERFRADLAADGLALKVSTHGSGMGLADFDRLAQIVGNLVANASHYAQTVVEVESGVDDGWLRVTVTDDGPGIASQDVPHVFERLYRANEQPERAEVGGGLGLAIVHRLVEAMGGWVQVCSPTERGTAFEFGLPLDSGEGV